MKPMLHDISTVEAGRRHGQVQVERSKDLLKQLLNRLLRRVSR